MANEEIYLIDTNIYTPKTASSCDRKLRWCRIQNKLDLRRGSLYDLKNNMDFEFVIITVLSYQI